MVPTSTLGFLALVLVVPAIAHPTAYPNIVKRADAIDDTTVLNYALTLEHLENAFYAGALAKFDAKAFTDAGLPPWARGRFEQIAAHEAAHVAFLSNALGANATKPCNYSFPYTDPMSFAGLSQTLEGVGVSAYLGAAQFITNKDYLTAAASVLTTEARHASWVAAAVNKGAGWNGALDVPLGLSEVYTLAAAFITGCPASNPTLPVTAFPALTLSGAGATKPGGAARVAYNGSEADLKSGARFVVFYTGLSREAVEVQNGSAVVPADLSGTVYAVVRKDANATDDASVVAGPAILAYGEDSAGKPE